MGTRPVLTPCGAAILRAARARLAGDDLGYRVAMLEAAAHRPDLLDEGSPDLFGVLYGDGCSSDAALASS